jgi:P4 family phage/plasmid primase-like protien
MENFKLYFNTFKCDKKTPYTHTSIGKPSCSLSVPDEKLPEFYQNYHRAMVQGVPLHLTEKPNDPSPMRIDLDYRFNLETQNGAPISNIKRLYKDSDTDRIMLTYFKLLASFLDAPEEAWIAYVMEKPNPVEYRGKIKDGIHVIWPHLVVSHSFQHLVRKYILDDSQSLFEEMPLINPAEDIIDQAIIDKNNWQMYGSRKPDCDAYRVTRVYKFDRNTRKVEILPMPSAQEELTFVELFSMRNKQTELVEIFEDRKEEVEEYIKHILPTMDARRKNKLHGQVFGKSVNLAKNIIGDEELNLAKRLVSECTSSKRSESYEEWIKLGWTLRNIDYRLLDSWIDISRLSSKYIEGECQKMWNQMRSDTMGMGTLRWIAKQDNPQKYEEIIDSNIVEIIDRAIRSEGAHFDVGCVVYNMFKDQFRYTPNNIWYMYRPDLHRWIRSKEGLKLRIILSHKVCPKFMTRSSYWSGESLRNHADDEVRSKCESYAKKALQISLKLKDENYKDSIIKACKSLFTDETFELHLDSHPHLIGFENGVYDLRLHEFRDGLPDDYISFSTGRNYRTYNHETIEAKEIASYLSQVYTNPNIRKYMVDIMSCILDGSIRQEKLYIFTGSGSNSKSVLLNLIQHALGEYYCILPIALLTQKRSSSNSAQSELERTKGRRIAVMQEPGESEKLNVGLMKELTGGDRILCRGLFKEPIEFRPQFKMIMTCNDLPEVPSDDGGTWRRIRVLEHTSKFTDSPDPAKANEFPLDPELSGKIETWADTFISMLIDNHNNIEPKDIVEPPEVVMATNSYRKNNDYISQYISEKVVVDATCTAKTMIQSLYNDFKVWAYNNMAKGKQIPRKEALKMAMEKLYGPYGLCWKGLRVTYEGTPETNEDDD